MAGGRRWSLAGRLPDSGQPAGRDGHSFAPLRAHTISGPARPAARPASRTHEASPPARARSLTLALATRRAEGGRGRSGLPRRGEGCLFAVRWGSRPERADWLGSSDPPLWQPREGGERERRREGPGSGTPARAGGRGGGGGGRGAAAEPAEGAGPAPLGNLRRLRSGRPREAGKRSGELGDLRRGRGIVLEAPRGWSCRAEGAESVSLRAGPQPRKGGA